MSEGRGFIETAWGEIGDTYQRVAWGPDSAAAASSAQTPEIEGPVIGAPDIGGADIGPPEPMTDIQLQSVVMDVQEQNFAADIAAPDPGDIVGPPLVDMTTMQDFTPIDAPIVQDDYEPQAAAIEAPEISGPEISADIGPSEGPDMG